MVKVLERQLGAQRIELDTRAGWAEFDVPNSIDPTVIVKAMVDAGYTMERVDFEVTGPIEQASGGLTLVVESNGQRLPMKKAEPGPKQKRRVTAFGWQEEGGSVHYAPAEKVIKTDDR